MHERRDEHSLNRRVLLRATAWSVPVIAVAASAPLAAASVEATLLSAEWEWGFGVFLSFTADRPVASATAQINDPSGVSLFAGINMNSVHPNYRFFFAFNGSAPFSGELTGVATLVFDNGASVALPFVASQTGPM